MPNRVTVVATQDPQWLLKLLVTAAVVTVLLTIGARLARARRNTLSLSFAIAFVSLLGGHFAARISLSPWGLLAAVVTIFAILCLSVRYVLAARLLASLAVAFATTVLLIAGILVVTVIGWA
jgi:hypothetical protein